MDKIDIYPWFYWYISITAV